ncbi:MAG: hypothetical protein JWQ87_2940 [Candidatus Sulfotelmatobacter sp.]|nr:hypothetical protein [Candidatus Sulfotelmatobacter sp.]
MGASIAGSSLLQGQMHGLEGTHVRIYSQDLVGR